MLIPLVFRLSAYCPSGFLCASHHTYRAVVHVSSTVKVGSFWQDITNMIKLDIKLKFICMLLFHFKVSVFRSVFYSYFQPFLLWSKMFFYDTILVEICLFSKDQAWKVVIKLHQDCCQKHWSSLHNRLYWKKKKHAYTPQDY